MKIMMDAQGREGSRLSGVQQTRESSGSEETMMTGWWRREDDDDELRDRMDGEEKYFDKEISRSGDVVFQLFSRVFDCQPVVACQLYFELHPCVCAIHRQPHHLHLHHASTTEPTILGDMAVNS